MTMKPFLMTRDISGLNGFGVPFSSNQYSVLLTAGVEKTLVVPPTQNSTYQNLIAIFSNFGSAVWVALNGTAEYPTGSSFAQTTSEQNPQARYVKVIIFFMLSINNIGITQNPLLDTPFIYNLDVNVSYPPPGSSFMLTESGQRMALENGTTLMITE